MKHDVMHASAQVDRFILDNVVHVKETIAQIDGKRMKAKKFGTVDLWNIRRKTKSAAAIFYR